MYLASPGRAVGRDRHLESRIRSFRLGKKQSTHNVSPDMLIFSSYLTPCLSSSFAEQETFCKLRIVSPANAALGRHRQVSCRTSGAHNVAPLKKPCSISTSMTYAPKVPPGLKDKEDHSMGRDRQAEWSGRSYD
jgi:hypothetical protein